MVAGIDYDHIALTRVRRRQPQSQFVRFAPRADEVADAECIGKGCGEALRVAHEIVVQIARVGVEGRHAPSAGPNHVRMRVSHVRYVVHRVEITTSVDADEVLHHAAHHVQGLPVRDAERGPHVRATTC